MSDLSKNTGNDVEQTKPHNLSRFQDLQIVEIDLLDKAKSLWEGRRLIMVFMAIFLAFAYFHAEYGPTEYSSTASLIQESEGAGVNEFGSSFFQSLTGMNISSGTGNLSAAATGRAPLPVSLYPQIISSTEFQKELIYTPIEFSELDTTVTIFEYYHKLREPAIRDRVYSTFTDYTIYLPLIIYDWTESVLSDASDFITGLWDEDSNGDREQNTENNITTIISDERLQSVTEEEMTVIEWMRLRISLSSSNGIMELTTRFSDPKAAAIVNALLIEYIQEYITEYRVQKARQNLETVVDRYEIAKQRYEEAQEKLARFRDQNINLSTQSAQIQESRLNNEVSLRFSVYNSIAQEVEQARMVLQQQIPVFNPLEKPNIPRSPSSGTSPLLMVFAGIVGIFVGATWILIQESSFVN